MTAPSVIAGVYADLRQVKSRGVWQLVLDIPAEKVEGMVELFGMPRQDEPTWLAVARLKVSPGPVHAVHGVAAEGNPPLPSTGPGESTRKSWYEQKPSARAGILCNSPAFWHWIEDGSEDFAIVNSQDAAAWLRVETGVSTRREYDTNPNACAKFEKIERAYRESRGLEAASR